MWFMPSTLRFSGSPRVLTDPGVSEQPIRAEIFSLERLEQHAISLAQAQVVSARINKKRTLAARAADNERTLLKCYDAMSQAIFQRRSVTPAAEWLLDNFRIIEEQLKDVRRGLEATSYRLLPTLTDGHLRGYPRIYGIAWAFVAHTDSRFDPSLLRSFLMAYQRIQPLTIAELWAVPITLRCVMVENLRRVCVNVADSLATRLRADELADRLLTRNGHSPKDIDAILRGLVSKPVAPAFTVQLIQRLRYQDISLHWLNEALARQGQSADSVVQGEHAGQAASNMTMRNLITSLRDMQAFDWQSFFESVSLVEHCLRQSPGYATMDFTTRDRYRHAIETLSGASTRSEMDIAALVVSKAAAGKLQVGDNTDRHADPGYYLLARGRRDFEKEIGYKPSFGQRCLRAYTARAATAYIVTNIAVTALILAIPLWLSAQAGVGIIGLCLLAVFGFFQASSLAVLLIDSTVTRLVAPRHLARLEFESGIPPALRTFVVIPTMLTTQASVLALAKQLEVHYLANRGGYVHFALLSDWTDADTENRENDTPLLNVAAQAIASLNTRYGKLPDGEPRFFLFHRKRLWNEAQKKWLSWERKRGKLHEFNRLLRGAVDTSFLPINGQAPRVPADVLYVITLDSDTRLPMGVVSQLTGTAAHPLNRPRIDPRSRRVVEGYGILQPRLTPMLSSSKGSSLFQRLFAGPCGIDPYSGAISNVYQDLFGEGSYTGKGIYNVDAFETALAGRIPENTILSHDLFEGLFARCGLVTDIELFEDFPSNYQVAASRSHRWIRGDWQLLPWIARFVGDPVPAISGWKMLDNLRRSCSAPAMILTLLTCWLIPQAPVALWTAYVLLTLIAPALFLVLRGLLPSSPGISKRSHLRAVGNDLLFGSAHAIVVLILLAHQAWLALDAIGRTLFRLLISHRLLLEWVTAAQTKLNAGLSIGSFTWSLRGAFFLVVLLAAAVAYFNPASLPAAAPFLILWCVSPIFARLVSLPPVPSMSQGLTAVEQLSLRLAGRRIWRFFTTFVSSQDNHLPPDNFQEDPHPVIAHRSSPTNFGLYLLSIISARDFGWIGVIETVERLEATLSTLQSLARFRGHFFNWYDTQSLSPLNPQYVSSVDSGNLAGHLLALANACTEMTQQAIFDPNHLAGIGDSVNLLRHAIQAESDDRRNLTVNLSQLYEGLNDFSRCLVPTPASAADWAARWQQLDVLAATLLDLAQTYAQERGDADHSEVLAWASAIRADVTSHLRDVPLSRLGPTPAYDNPDATSTSPNIAQRLDALAAIATQLFQEMEFKFLFDYDRSLFSIGYRVKEGELDNSYYDLLASEARLASYVAIAKGEIAPSHWFRLGRIMTEQDAGAVLMSWSGSMFEYLMPSLVMYTPHYTVLQQTCRLAVARQIAYGRELGLPWGISESAYNMRDRAFTYQYADFGVPGLGLKIGLARNMVIAPYATALAAMYQAAAAMRNFQQIDALGGLGVYGYYDAIDFTPARVPDDQTGAPVRTYMAHHQGMSLVALNNVLFNDIMRHRFHRNAIVRAADLLLQEPQPREVGVISAHPDIADAAIAKEIIMPVSRRFRSAKQTVPSAHLLSNGRYSVMVTTAGSGYSAWDDMAVTRWREDPTCDNWGSYLFLRDTASGKVWSATYQPLGDEPDRYEITFSEDRVRIARHDASLATVLEILVSPEDNAEIRRISITNSGTHLREIELTSYAEVVLAPMAADVAHPAFSNLFIQTEYLPETHALMAMRRPYGASDSPVWAAHLLAGGTGGDTVGYETDRMRFLGRGHSIRNPVAVMDGRPLSNTVGSVLDPVFSLRTSVAIAPGATVHVALVTMTASTREEIIDLADKYRDPGCFERVSTLGWTQAHVWLHHLGITADEANLFQFLASRVLYCDPFMRPSSDILKRNTLNATSLWKHSISGDLPIVLLRIDDLDDRQIVRQLLRAHEYWHGKGLAIDLIMLNEKKNSYIQDLQTALENMVSSSKTTPDPQSRRGGIFVLRADLLEPSELDLLHCAARVILSGNRQGSLEEQVVRMRRAESRASYGTSPNFTLPRTYPDATPPMPALAFFNGLGGFDRDGREYVTVLGQAQRTPAPWINVIANPDFGFQVSQSGSGYTWAENSQANQLTVWSNDPVSDTPSEVFYLRDDETGELWTPTALPIRLENTQYIARHGHGYSRFQHGSHGIFSELLQFVSWTDPVKISTLTLENRSTRVRKLTVTSYTEWVLGTSRQASAPFIVTEMDPDTGAMFARNPWNAEFGERIAFVDWIDGQTSWTGDRGEFLGRNGNIEQPAALLSGLALSNHCGAGMDPCSALQTVVELAPAQRIELTFILGQAENRQAARALVSKYRSVEAQQTLSEVTRHWDEILNKVQVKTTEPATDLLLNGWLLYQVLACRMWARTAFYQASGAYGFRDQLQDSMALSLARPDVARAHLLRAAARQFVEGDVQHWWHPPSGRGVRTHITDDRIWLPFTVAHYISITGDTGVLDETVPFLEGVAVAADQENAYYAPAVSQQTGSLLEHCVRAINCSLTNGTHGLPLMGGGDWNDGMNRVGEKGKGESVWLGWFLYSSIEKFSPLVAAHGDQDTVQKWRRHADALQLALEEHAWDGAWYRRAYFDDGTPLGSSADTECRIDSIAQSWSVISGAGDPARQLRAMQSVEQYLVRQGDDLVLLLAPPFDKTPLDPGYIKGYLPGVRENGGQYTHAAAWCMIAYTLLGDGNRAGELLKMLNPINHTSTRAGVHAYKVEPYVVAGDIYSASEHIRRGGWTWYTGSAGWLYRGGIESVLGFAKHGNSFSIDPCIPQDWTGFELNYQHGTSRYSITVENPHGISKGVDTIKLDGQRLPGSPVFVPLLDDGQPHSVLVTMGVSSSI